MSKINKEKKSQPYRIDVHHHIIPPFYVAVLESLGITTSFGLRFPNWSAKEAMNVMDKNRIATAITSISTPGVYFKDSSFSRDLARRCNEYSSQLMRDYPGRFGAFASLPLPDVEGALRELEYAMDTLKLDGVVLMSNVEGHYPGNQAYDELFAEFNHRKIVVYIHPHDPPDAGIPEYLKGPLDAALDTTRAAVSLLYAGFLERYPDIRFILSHTGGIVPYLARRIVLGRYEEANQTAYDKGMYDFTLSNRDPEEGLKILKSLYYDTLSPAGNDAFRTLQEFVEPSHILLATDYVFLPKIFTSKKIVAVKNYKGFNDHALKKIERENALELFPRLKEV
ncbi:amidohydrolase family protein [Chloroflexota bacterium]